ncbi:putative RiPP precursor [Mesorhizobium sp. CU2]|nr:MULTISPECIES: putative RiPP precursor [unclassified Mesorhizobium]TPN86658.1 putative RiPP precursor [Mesorhizobium sp. CU3]TPO20408.1 putative RiPP precursor [Mesorhizobium sp. CU2]
MKKTYEKPVLVRRQRLSKITAVPTPSTVIIEVPVD